MDGRRVERARAAGVVGVLVLLALAVWIVPFFGDRQMLYGQDAVEQTWTWWNFNVEQWQAGRLPLWNPYVSAGMSNVGEGQMGALYPVAMLAAHLAGPAAPTIGTLAVLSALHFLVTAAGGYLLPRVLGLGRGASLVAAVTIALAGATLWRATGQLNIYWSMSWIPLALAAWAAALVYRRRLVAIAAGACFALSLYAGHAQGLVLGAVMAGAIGVVLVVPRVRPRSGGVPLRTAVALGGIFVGSFVVLGLPQLWAQLVYLGDAYRWVGAAEPVRGLGGASYDVVAANSHLGFSDVLSAVVASRQTADGSVFLGVAALALALLGLVSLGRFRRVRAAGAALAILGTLIALGPRTPFLALWVELPLVSQVRQPIRYDILIAVGIALLAAVGTQVWLEHARRRWVAAGILAASATAGAVVGHWSVPSVLVVAVLVVAPVAVILVVRRTDRGLLRLAAVGVVTMTLLFAWWGRLPPVTATDLPTPQARFGGESLTVATLLEHRLGPDGTDGRARIATDRISRNLGTLAGIPTVSGYSATLPAPFYDLLTAFRFDDRVWDLLGVVATVEDRGDDVVVVENPGAYDPGWFVESAPYGGTVTADEVVAAVDAGADLTTTALLSGTVDPGGEFCAGTAELRRRDASGLVFEVSCPEGGVLVTSEIWDPAWTAVADRGDADIVRADASLVAVRVPPGAVEITLRYVPPYAAVGIPIALGGALGALALALTKLARRGRLAPITRLATRLGGVTLRVRGRRMTIAEVAWPALTGGLVVGGVVALWQQDRPVDDLRPRPDAPSYAYQAIEFASGNFFGGIPAAISGGEETEGYAPSRYPPGFSLLLSLVSLVRRSGLDDALIGSAAVSAILLVAVALTARRMAGWPAAAVAAAAMLSTPFLWQSAQIVMSDALGALCAVIALLIVHEASADGRGTRARLALLVLLGGVAAFATVSRLALVVLAIAAFAAVRKLADVLPILVGAVPWIVVLVVYDTVVFGAPWITGYDYYLPTLREFGLDYLTAWNLPGDGAGVYSDAFDGALMQWACPCPMPGDGVLRFTPPFVTYPAALLGLYWMIAPPLLLVAGAVWAVRERRSAAGRFVILVTVLNVGMMLVYFYQAIRLIAPAAAVLVVVSAVAVEGGARRLLAARRQRLQETDPARAIGRSEPLESAARIH